MGTIKAFTDIIAWQKSEDSAIKLRQSLQCNKDFSYCDQIRRASLSIMNNIAEGFGRYRGKEFRQFLAIAKGSNMEVQSMIFLGHKTGYFNNKQRDELLVLTEDKVHLIKALIKSIIVK